METWKEGEDFWSYCPSVKSSLPQGTHFKYETHTINKIYINKDLQWTNPRSRNSGVRTSMLTELGLDPASQLCKERKCALSQLMASWDAHLRPNAVTLHFTVYHCQHEAIVDRVRVCCNSKIVLPG